MPPRCARGSREGGPRSTARTKRARHDDVVACPPACSARRPAPRRRNRRGHPGESGGIPAETGGRPDDAAHAAHGSPADAPATDAGDATATGHDVHEVWPVVVHAVLAVRNAAAAPVLFSPRQVRLRLRDGTTVMPVDAERPPGPLAPRATTRTWVEFLAPAQAVGTTLELTPAGAGNPVGLGAVAVAHHGGLS